MKVIYRGHEIEAHRERSMGGDILLYYSIFRQSDGWELTSGFTYGEDTIRDFIGYMKERVDAYIVDPSEEELDDNRIEYHKEQLKGLTP